MRAPGTDQRTTEDRTCEIACQCGAILTTLAAGEHVATSGPVQTRSLTCATCGRVTKLKIAAGPSAYGAPDA